MVQAQNFLASWQLFPEKSNYEQGNVLRSGFLRLEARNGDARLHVQYQRVSLDGQASFSEYAVEPNGQWQSFAEGDETEVKAELENASRLAIAFRKAGVETMQVVFDILPNGYLRSHETYTLETGETRTNRDVYHKQLSVLPYASSAGSVAIRPTEEGAIKHIALRAMEEQTNMQLDQIREQIDLLARQAQELRRRRDLSLMIYDAKLSFQPVIGQTYYLYEKRDGSHTLSLVSPGEWGGTMPFKSFLSAVKLLADHTWTELQPEKKKQAFTTINLS